MTQTASAATFDAVAAVYANPQLVDEVRAHNLAVIIRRRRGADWSAPENQYRNLMRELEAASALRAAA